MKTPMSISLGAAAGASITGPGRATVPYPAFVYGTLMSLPVLETLLGRSLSATEKSSIRPAYLLNSNTNQQGCSRYSRHPVRDHVFPAVIETTEQHQQSTPLETADVVHDESSLPIPSSSSVGGLLLPSTMLTPKDMTLLDYFESEEYIRKVVQVSLTKIENDTDETEHGEDVTTDGDGNDIVQAHAYIWRPDLISRLELDQEWSFENFQSQHLEWYLKNVVRPCRSEMEQLGMT